MVENRFHCSARKTRIPLWPLKYENKHAPYVMDKVSPVTHCKEPFPFLRRAPKPPMSADSAQKKERRRGLSHGLIVLINFAGPVPLQSRAIFE